MKMSHQICRSFVYHGDECFFVSTINRECSSPESYGGTYAETMVWTYNDEVGSRSELLYMGSSSTDSLHTHFKVCQLLVETGKPEKEED